MTARLASLFAAAGLSLATAPAVAQWRDGPPPLPAFDAPDRGPSPEGWDDAAEPEDFLPEERRFERRLERRTPRPDRALRSGYSREERDGWLDQCRGSYRDDEGHGGRGGSDWDESCEDYLRQYEHGFGPGMDHGMPPGAYITPGYVVPPIMWVKVPIFRERAQACECEEVIEEHVVARPARRVVPRRPEPEKRVRNTK